MKITALIFVTFFAAIMMLWQSFCLENHFKYWSDYILFCSLVVPLFLPKLFLDKLLKTLSLFLFLLLPFFGFHTWHIQNILWEFLLSSILYCLCIYAFKNKKENQSQPSQWEYSLYLISAFVFLSILQLPFEDLRNYFFVHGFKEGAIGLLVHDASTISYPIAHSFRFCLLVLLANYLANFIHHNQFTNVAIKALALGFFISVTTSILELFSIINIDWIPHPYTRSSLFATTYGNYAWFAQLLTSILPLFFILLLQNIKWIQRTVTALITLFSLFLIFSSSRAALLVLPIVIIGGFLIIQLKKNDFSQIWKKLLVLMPLFAFIILAILAFIKTSEHPALSIVKSKLENFSESERLDIWKNAKQMTSLSPLTGFGYGSYRLTDQSLDKLSQLSNDSSVYYHHGKWYNDTPHNFFYEWVSGVGFIGISLLLSHVALLFICIQKVELENKTTLYLLFFSLIVFFIYALFQEMTYLTSITFLWLWIICLCWNQIWQNLNTNFNIFRYVLFFKVSVFSIGLIMIALNTGGNIYKKYFSNDTIESWVSVHETLGAYPTEEWNGKKVFWTNRGLIHPTKIINPNSQIRIQCMNANTHKKNGLTILFFINDSVIKEHQLTRDKMIETISLDTSQYLGKNVVFKMRIGKTFNPSDLGNSEDDRELGVVIHAEDSDPIFADILLEKNNS